MGGFNIGHFLDPVGLTIGKGKGGGIGNFWDPLNLTNKASAPGGASAADNISAAPVPVPAPPVTGAAAEVIAAQQDIARQNLLKKSVRKTIFAGDSGGFQPGNANIANAPSAPASYAKPRF